MPPKATVSARAPLLFVPIETQRITRSAALRCKANDPAGNSKIPLGINCICGHNFINPSDTLMLCEKCSFWSHKKCVGLASMSAHEVTKMKFMCPFCSGELVKRHRTAESATSSRKSERHPEGLMGGADDSRTLPSVSAPRTSIARVKLEEVPDKNPQPSVASLVRATLSLLIADLEANADVLLEFIPPLLPTTMLPEYPADGEGVIVGNISVVSPSQSSDAEAKLSARGTSATLNVASTGGAGRRRINLSAAVNRNAATQCTDTGSFHSQNTLTSPSPSSTSAANAISASTSACSAHSSGAARSGFSNEPRESSQERTSVAMAAAALNSLSPDDLAPHENPFYPKKFYNTLTDSMILECLDCCKSAIANATFSESYPDYCLRELQAFPHKYLQGTFARCKRSKKVIAFILTNGMDEYGNLKSSLSQLRQANNKALAANGVITSAPNSSPTSPTLLNAFSFPSSLNGGLGQPTILVGGAGTTVTNTAFTEECLRITDINDFVHITLVATHEDHRGRGLAKKLMLADSLRWLIRGRTRAYLNMALERVKVPIGARPPNTSAAAHPPQIALDSQTDDIDGLASYPLEDALTEDTLLLGVKRSRDGTPIDELSEVLKPNAEIDVGGGRMHPGDGSLVNGRASKSEEEYDVVCVASESSRRLYTSLGFVDVVPSKIDPVTNEIKWTPKEEEGGKVMANLDMKESARTVSRHIFGDTAPLYSGRKVLKLKK